jgi:hypothetical protein
MLEEIVSAIIGSIVGIIGAALIRERPPKPVTGGLREFMDNILYRSPRIVAPRRRLVSDEFYEPYYQNAHSIQVSGVALTGLINYICRAHEDNLPKTHLIQVVKEKPVTVRLLLMDPKSKFVEDRRESERNPGLPKDIYDNIRLLGDFKEHLDSLRPADRAIEGRLEIRMSSEELPYSIFNSEPMKPRKPGIMYLGLLFPNLRGDESPLIYIRNTGDQSRLYRNCLTHFEFVYKSATAVFQWVGAHAVYYGQTVLD